MADISMDWDIAAVKSAEKNPNLKANEEAFDKECGVGKWNSFDHIMFSNTMLFRHQHHSF